MQNPTPTQAHAALTKLAAEQCHCEVWTTSVDFWLDVLLLPRT